MNHQIEARVLTVDIETSPIEAYVWSIWQDNIGLDMVKEDWALLSFSAKWLDKNEVQFHHTGGRGPAKIKDDKALCGKLWNLLDQADVCITQNGKQFDMKKINARLVFHGFKPYSPVKVIDTKLIAKKHFGFTSNKLEFMTGQLNKQSKKDKHNKFPGFSLWTECMKDNPAAWAEMKKYNQIDVISTEELYLKLRPWMEGHPNLANYSLMEELQCPKCSSLKVQKRGLARTQTGEYLRIQCQSCGGWSRTRYTMNTKEKRENLLSN